MRTLAAILASSLIALIAGALVALGMLWLGDLL